MNKALRAFLEETQTELKNGKQIHLEVLVVSNIISGNLVEISNDLETVTLSDIHRNDKYLNTTLTILSEHILGWHAKVRD